MGEAADSTRPAALAARVRDEASSHVREEARAQIEEYKAEYAVLISETQAIKGESELVQAKVERSKELLRSLAEERTRWEEGSLGTSISRMPRSRCTSLLRRAASGPSSSSSSDSP